MQKVDPPYDGESSNWQRVFPVVKGMAVERWQQVVLATVCVWWHVHASVR